MKINENLAENSKAIIGKLIQAIEDDEQITSSDSLSFQATKDSLPEICQTIVKAIADNNLSLLALHQENQGSKHGYVRCKQDFEPEEIVREFFLLKQIVTVELKPYLLAKSPEQIVEQMTLIDLIVNRVMENSFQSYAKTRRQQLDSLHQQLFLTNQELTRLVEDSQQSFSYLVHEIKNPLTSIIGYSDLFLRQQTKHDTSNTNLEHIQQVLNQGRKVLRLVNDTSEISSYKEGSFKLRIQEINICTLLEDIVLGLTPSIEAKELNLITSCIPQQLIIKSDPLRLQQIITNLLINAIRYTKSGQIELRCCILPKNKLEIKVCDTGIGISEFEQKRIFEPYFRTQQSQQDVPEGIGLGLAIVSQLVSLLEGNIELISKVNVGSIFTVTIPLAPSTVNSDLTLYKNRRVSNQSST